MSGSIQPALMAPVSATSAGRLAVSVSLRRPGGFALKTRFAVPPGITILFGPSGSGKTTLLNCIAGITRPDSGEIVLGSRRLFDSGRGIDVPVRKRGCGYVFQSLALFPHLTVGQNVEYGLDGLRDSPPTARRQRALAILQSFRIAALRDRLPQDISAGERQRVALARSLVTQPRLLLLDEPLSALDAATKWSMIEDLRAWDGAREIPILYVTHASDEAFALGERMIVLDGGTIAAQGTPAQILERPRRETVAQLAGFENIFQARVTELREREGIMVCLIESGHPDRGGESDEDGKGGVHLDVPLARAAPGDQIRIAIRAGDIMLAAPRPQGLSARNVLAGELRSLEQLGTTMIAEVDAGVPFEVHLTPGACEQMGLEVGLKVWLVIKTYSCHPVTSAEKR